MIFYAHRGNIYRAIPAMENSPDYIDTAIAEGWSVEVDLRKVGSTLFLGHDFPQYVTSLDWLTARQSKLLIHLKDIEAAKFLQKATSLHTFCHANDPFTMTSQGCIWHHDLSTSLTGIVPLLTEQLLTASHWFNCHGVCSDYVYNAQKQFLKQHEN